MRTRVDRRLREMEELRRRAQPTRGQAVDLRRLTDGELEQAERLALSWQARTGSFQNWLAALPDEDIAVLEYLYARAAL